MPTDTQVIKEPKSKEYWNETLKVNGGLKELLEKIAKGEIETGQLSHEMIRRRVGYYCKTDPLNNGGCLVIAFIQSTSYFEQIGLDADTVEVFSDTGTESIIMDVVERFVEMDEDNLDSWDDFFKSAVDERDVENAKNGKIFITDVLGDSYIVTSIYIPY